ncbi:MAG: aquaporin, partial [Deltaproteobacteria bacterium]|nr:aquaporin [Deltaproteobacteria bacterium]
FAAEAIGTFALVFAGTGAMVTHDVTGGVVTHVGVALTFGLVILAMIYAVGDVSGAHFNPAVTVGFYVARRLPGVDVLPYGASQFAGACLASAILRWVFPDHATLGATLPAIGVAETLVLEVILTFFLMFVILGVSTGAKEEGATAGLAIGGTVALAALFAGPLTGASMNPARSLGPALLGGQMGSLWIYFVAPLIGAGLAVVGCRCTREEGCCTAEARA